MKDKKSSQSRWTTLEVCQLATRSVRKYFFCTRVRNNWLSVKARMGNRGTEYGESGWERRKSGWEREESRWECGESEWECGEWGWECGE